LKDLKRGNGESKKGHKSSKDIRVVNDKIEGIERKLDDYSERLLTLETKFTVTDKDLR
jgi:hypothetical protein